ncbi:MAG: PAS domain-containing protein [Mariprofundales bacterium]|nr:PAS domain-containing protein [Mariprofundales bacterium]
MSGSIAKMLEFSLLDNVQEGVVVLDHTGRVLFWNRIMLQWAERTSDEVVGLDISSLAPKLGEDHYRDRMMAVVETRSPAIFSAGSYHHLIPCPLSVDGSVIYRSQDTTISPVSINGSQLLMISVVDCTDHLAGVKELMRANARLERSVRLRRESDRVNTMLAAGMDNAAEAIVVLDHRGRIEYANNMFYSMAQVTSPTVRNRLLQEVLIVDQSDLLRREVKSAIASGEMWRGRVVVRRTDGSRFPVSVSAAPVRLRKGRGYQVSHTVLILNDITDYEVANHDLQARKRSEAMLTMVAGISHDFNNIISGMVGNAYLLRRSVGDDEKGLRRLHTIEEALEDASAIIQDLVIYARGAPMEPGVLPLTPFVKEWSKEVRGMLPDSVELRLDIEIGSSPVHVDVRLFQNALMEVAQNAKEAVERVENPCVSIAFHHIDDDERPAELSGSSCVLLTVTDNGCGISEEDIVQVCDPFFSTKKLGSGLGLAVARSSIEQHHGLFCIDSEEGVGTTVSIWLPLAE